MYMIMYYLQVLNVRTLSRIFSLTLRSAGHSNCTSRKLSAMVIFAAPDMSIQIQALTSKHTFIAHVERQGLERLRSRMPLSRWRARIEEARKTRTDFPHEYYALFKGQCN